MVDSRSVKVYLKGDISDYNRAMLEAEGTNKSFGRSLDSSNDRMSNLVQSSLALGPALVPITAAAIPALTGLSNQLGISVAAIGVGTLAFKGLGKALDAVNAASLDPTAANLQKVNLELSQLGPAGQDFVLFLQRARPEIQHLQELSRAGLFPGIEKGLHSLAGLLPDAEHIITTISSTLGDLAEEGGANLDSPKWHEFIAFLDAEARPTLLAMGRTLGNFSEGIANLWMAFAPLSNNFSKSFLGLSRDFSKWTDGLDKTQGFQDFLDYVDKTGPEVWATLGSLGNALLQIVEAAAPVGSAVLPVIKAVSDAVAILANSDLGPVIIGIVSLTSALSRLKALGIAANSSAIGGLVGRTSYAGTLTQVKALPGALLAVESASERANTKAGALSATSLRLGTSMRATAKLAGLGGGLAFAMTGLDQKMGLADTTTLAMAGSVAGPWGTAIGAGVGLALDFAHRTDDVGAAMERAKQAVDQNKISLKEQQALIDEARRKANQHGDPVPGGRGVVTNTTGATAANTRALNERQQVLDKNVRKAQDAAFAEAGLAGQMANSSKATRDETYALLENIRAKNSAADAAENVFAAETNYRQALKDAEAQARTNSAGIEGSSKAALANRSSLDQLATSWNRVADAGNATKSQMDKARANFIKVAEDMGVSKDAARVLARELLHIPSPNVKVNVTTNVKNTADFVQHVLNGIHGKTVEVHFKSTGRVATNQADGGYITGPGGPRDDLIPAMLSNGEFVVNAAATRANLSLLHQLNAQKFADGGPVVQRMTTGSTSAAGSTSSTTLSASIVGARVAIDKDGLMSFVDGRIEIGQSQANNYAGAGR